MEVWGKGVGVVTVFTRAPSSVPSLSSLLWSLGCCYRHPAMTSVVDWVLKANYLSIWVVVIIFIVVVPEGRPGIFLMSPPCLWNLRAVSLIPLFCISSLVLLLPSPFTLSVLSAFGPLS